MAERYVLHLTDREYDALRAWLTGSNWPPGTMLGKVMQKLDAIRPEPIIRPVPSRNPLDDVLAEQQAADLDSLRAQLANTTRDLEQSDQELSTARAMLRIQSNVVRSFVHEIERAGSEEP